jgi:hypothetical protein
MRFIYVVLAALLMCLPAGAQGQTRSGTKKPAKSSQPNPFLEKVWYGVGPNIGFGAFNGNSTFGLGLSGQAGYMFDDMFSIGPRFNVFYTSAKYVGFKSLNLFDTELGGFLRAKVWRGLFLQGDLSNSWTQVPGNPQTNNTISKYSYQRFNQWVGAGWNSGAGQVGTELSYHYNFAVANDLFAFEAPWEFRFMITWKF